MLAHGLVIGLAGERPASAAHINRGGTLLRYNLTFGPFCVTNSGLGQNLAKMTPQRDVRSCVCYGAEVSVLDVFRVWDVCTGCVNWIHRRKGDN